MVPQAVIDQLIKMIGRENVLTQREEKVCYSYDATPGVGQKVPDLVVVPRDRDDVLAIVKTANENKIPLYVRGSGTNLSGGTIPLEGGIVVSMLSFNKILEIDAENLTATVQPGVIVQALNDAVTEYGLIYPPDPGTVKTATIGGTVAECAGGLKGLKYGVTKHYIMGMEAITGSGELIRCGGKTVKNVSGYDLTNLFVGSEGTLAIITEITVKLMPAPESHKSMIAAYDDLFKAGQSVADIIARKVIPATLEIMDNLTIRTVVNYAKVDLPVDAQAVLLIEVDGIKDVVEREAEIVEKVCRENGAIHIGVAQNDEERDKIWTARRAALPALAQIKPTVVLEDATVPRSKVPDMIKVCQEIGKRYNLDLAVMGHAGDGNLHPTFIIDPNDEAEKKRLEAAIDELFEAALQLGGTLSGEHGIGIAKAKYLEWQFGDSGLRVMKHIKDALDPNGILNPGKIFIS